MLSPSSGCMTVSAISLYLPNDRLFRLKAEEGALKLVDANQARFYQEHRA